MWRKRCFCLNGNLQCYKVVAIAREGNAFLQTYPSRVHFIFIEPTINSVKAFYDDSCKRSCDAILARTTEFWLFTTSRKSCWRSFLIKKKHEKSREHSISSKIRRKKLLGEESKLASPSVESLYWLAPSLNVVTDCWGSWVYVWKMSLILACWYSVRDTRFWAQWESRWWGRWSLDELSSYVRIKTQFALVCADLCMSPLYGCIHL